MLYFVEVTAFMLGILAVPPCVAAFGFNATELGLWMCLNFYLGVF